MMEQPTYNVFTLPNGLKCVHRHTLSKAAYLGVIVNAGSRDDGNDTYGLAHFVEHTIFKGTTHRNSWHISNRMESVGGDLNAYTSKEQTVVYTTAPSGHTERGLELLADLVNNSTFPESELEKERLVVEEEIFSYRDSVVESLYDCFDDMIYAHSEVGHNILGTPESLAKLKADDCHGFTSRFYTAPNMVLYVSSADKLDNVRRWTAKHFSYVRHHTPIHNRPEPPVNPAFFEVRDEKRHQAHTLYGTRIFGRHDDRKYALSLLNNYLAGPGMNSVLNQELRDRKGLVYTVESNTSMLGECGTFMIYYGTEKSKIKKCHKIIRNRLDSLAQNPMKPTLFNRIKQQYIGQLTIASDQQESVAMSLGKTLLYYGEPQPADKLAERLRDVTAEQVREVAELLAEDKFSTLTFC